MLRDFLVIALQQSVDGQTDGPSDGQTDTVITIGLPHLRWQGPKKSRSGSQGKVTLKEISSRSIPMQGIESVLINVTENKLKHRG